jgi:hypothetical protein
MLVVRCLWGLALSKVAEIWPREIADGLDVTYPQTHHA